METVDKEKIKENTKKLVEFISRKFEAGELSNESLLEVFKLPYLNLETIPKYAKRTGLSYQGVKVGRRIEVIHGTRFVIDNE